MNASQAADLLRRLANHWSHQLAEGERSGWLACLAPIPPDVADAVLEQLKAEQGIPTQRRFLELAQDMARRQPSGNPRRHCQHCGGTGWREVEVSSGADAVLRCVCVPPPLPPEKHPRGCTCSIHALGAPEPGPEPVPRGPDPLALAEPEVPGGMF